MIHIVLEEKYKETTWCERIIGGIERQSRTKKIKYDFKSNKELIYVLTNTDYYLNNKDKSLSKHFLKDS